MFCLPFRFYQGEAQAGYWRLGGWVGILIPLAPSLSYCCRLTVFVPGSQGCPAAPLYTSLWVPVTAFPLVPSDRSNYSAIGQWMGLFYLRLCHRLLLCFIQVGTLPTGFKLTINQKGLCWLLTLTIVD